MREITEGDKPLTTASDPMAVPSGSLHHRNTHLVDHPLEHYLSPAVYSHGLQHLEQSILPFHLIPTVFFY